MSTKNQISDSQIVELLINKNSKGIKAIWAQYGAALYGIVFKVINDQFYAEEVFGKVLRNISNNITSYQSEHSTFYFWLSNLARDTALEKVQLKSYNRIIRTQLIYEKISVANEESKTLQPLNLLDIAEILSDEDRIVLEAAYLMGLTTLEISEQLEVSTDTVISRLLGAVRKLMTFLDVEKNSFAEMAIQSDRNQQTSSNADSEIFDGMLELYVVDQLSTHDRKIVALIRDQNVTVKRELNKIEMTMQHYAQAMKLVPPKNILRNFKGKKTNGSKPYAKLKYILFGLFVISFIVWIYFKYFQ